MKKVHKPATHQGIRHALKAHGIDVTPGYIQHGWKVRKGWGCVRVTYSFGSSFRNPTPEQEAKFSNDRDRILDHLRSLGYKAENQADPPFRDYIRVEGI